MWEVTAEPAPVLAPLEAAAETEVAIIGAGFSGLSTALALAERGVAVRVLEAKAPGAGASGANGGQVIPGLRHFAADLITEYGEALGRRLHEHAARDADATFALIERHGIACDATRNGWLQVADSDVELAACMQRAQAWADWGAPAHALDAEGALLSARLGLAADNQAASELCALMWWPASRMNGRAEAQGRTGTSGLSTNFSTSLRSSAGVVKPATTS